MGYNKSMDTLRTDNLRVRPDPKTGKLPTQKQLDVLRALNPFCSGKKPTSKEAASALGISVAALKTRLATFRKRCPILSQRFRLARFPKKREYLQKIYSEPGRCCYCGRDIPEKQDICFRCWRKRDRKLNPDNYKKDPMFPTNGVTKSTIDWDKWEDNDYLYGRYIGGERQMDTRKGIH